jgi:hypothetical protein
MATIDVRAEVAALAATIRAGAADAHEARSMFMLAGSVLQVEFVKAAQESAEAMAALVLEKRAADAGVSVDDQKEAAGALLNKRAEQVTALEALEAPILQPVVAVEAPAALPEPKLAPTKLPTP